MLISKDLEKDRQWEIKDVISRGIVPLVHEPDGLHEDGRLTDEIKDYGAMRPIRQVVESVYKVNQSA